MKPPGRFRPDPPRRADRASLGFLVTAAVVVIWLGLYGLLIADIVNEQMLLVIILLTAPIAFFPVIVSGSGMGLTRPGSCAPEWPPIDIIVPWPLDDDSERTPRRTVAMRKRSRHAGPPSSNNP